MKRECGCSSYLTIHDSWCEETPVFAQLVREWGGNPCDAWPFIVFALIGYNKENDNDQP